MNLRGVSFFAFCPRIQPFARKFNFVCKKADYFSNWSNSLNLEAKLNCNTTRQNGSKWRKSCTGSKYDLVHFNGPQIKFIFDSLYKLNTLNISNTEDFKILHKNYKELKCCHGNAYILNRCMIKNRM